MLGTTNSAIFVPCVVFAKIPQLSAALKSAVAISFVSFDEVVSFLISSCISFIVNSCNASLSSEIVLSRSTPKREVMLRLKRVIQSSASSSEALMANVASKGIFFSLYSDDFPRGTKIFTGRDFVSSCHSLRSSFSFSFLNFIVQKIPMVSKMSEAMFFDASSDRFASSSAMTPIE